MTVSFDGFDNKAITFMTEEMIDPGTIVTLSDPGTVSPAGSNDIPIGVVLGCDGSYACVGVRGVYKMPCSSSVGVGFYCLETNSEGRLTEGTDGIYRFVLDVDETSGTATVLL